MQVSKVLCFQIAKGKGEGGTLYRMPIASLILELAIEHAHSLKDRRQAVRSLKDKLRRGFNVSVAELDDAMVWNRATLGVAAISSSAAYLAGQLREVEDAVRRLGNGLGCEVLDSYIESDVVLGNPNDANPNDGDPGSDTGSTPH